MGSDSEAEKSHQKEKEKKKIQALAPIAKPLAGKKLCKRTLKLVRRGIYLFIFPFCVKLFVFRENVGKPIEKSIIMCSYVFNYTWDAWYIDVKTWFLLMGFGDNGFWVIVVMMLCVFFFCYYSCWAKMLEERSKGGGQKYKTWS